MPIDARLLLAGIVPDVQPVDLAAAYAQGQGIAANRQQLTLRELAIGKEQEQRAKDITARSFLIGAIDADGNIDYGKLRSAYGKAGDLAGLAQVGQLQREEAQAAENQAHAKERQVKAQQQALSLAHPVLVGIKQNPALYQQGLRLLARQYRSMGLEESAKIAEELLAAYPEYDAAMVDNLLAMSTQATKGPGDYGVEPIYGEQNGQRTVAQLNRRGGLEVAKMPPGFVPYGPGAYAPKPLVTPTTIYEQRPTGSGIQLRVPGVGGTPIDEQGIRDEVLQRGGTPAQADQVVAEMRAAQGAPDLAQQAETRQGAEQRGKARATIQAEVLEKAKKAQSLLEETEAKQQSALAEDGVIAHIKRLAPSAGVYRPGGRELENLTQHDKYQRRVNLEKMIESLGAHLSLGSLAEMKEYGGSLGPYSDKDSQILSQHLAAIHPDMSPKALEASLDKLSAFLKESMQRRRNAFERDYKGVDTSAAPGTPQGSQGGPRSGSSGVPKALPRGMAKGRLTEDRVQKLMAVSEKYGKPIGREEAISILQEEGYTYGN